MSLRQTLAANEDVLDQAAGITGVGWTVSLLAYLSVVLSQGTTVVTSPQPLLYLGGVLFLATVGLDRLRASRTTSQD